MKFYHILGPVLAIIAMLFWANAMVKKEKGIEYKIGPRLFLLAAVVLYHLFFTNINIWDKMALLALDFGIGMIVNVGYLAYHKAYPKVFLGLGSMALVVSGAFWGIGSAVGAWNMAQRADAESVLIEIGADDKISELEDLFEEYEVVDFEQAFPMVDESEDIDLSHTYIVWVPAEQEAGFLKALARDTENVDVAEENLEFSLWPEQGSTADLTPQSSGTTLNDPLLARQWWLADAEKNGLFKSVGTMAPKSGKKAVVAILDTGVKGDHEDLTDIFGDSPNSSDWQTHGTHCAGLAGAASNNGKGVASLNLEGNFIEIRSYQCLLENGRGGFELTAEMIIQAAEDGADVISMSLGAEFPVFMPKPAIVQKAIDYANKQGAIVVAASGNAKRDARNTYPAALKGVISVSAVDQNLRVAEFSNLNQKLEMPLSAPGVDIYSTLSTGDYGPLSGTSMACPIVAGYLGFMKALEPDLTAKEAFKILNETGTAPHRKDRIGNIVQVEALVKEMQRRGE